MKIKCLVIVLLTFSTIAAISQKPAGKIEKIIQDLEAFEEREFPADTIVSEHPLGRFSEADFVRRNTFYDNISRSLNSINATELNGEAKINLELLKYLVQIELTSYRYKEYFNPILADEGFHTRLPRLATDVYGSKKEYAYYQRVLDAIPVYIDEHLALMSKGLALGISQPKAALTNYERTYEQHIVSDPEQSIFYKPFLQQPKTINNEDWQAITNKGKEAISNKVIPGFKRIKQFFDAEYYPKARTTLGASYLPDGKAYYDAKVKQFTTTNLSADEVYELGEQEVKRIRKEMDEVIKEVSFKGSFKEFIEFLRSDPQFFVTTPEQLLKEASFIAKKIDGNLPLLFGKLPRQPYGVVPVPDHLAQSYTTGRYGGAPINSKQSGRYFVNTSNLKSRTLYTLEALTLHEAVPGHHLQIALTQELTKLPKFRQSLYINAFGEGWGLYAEYLGYELGLYKDPYSRFGRLTYEMWRACRLVIDVGIHAKSWTREQAVSFLADNTALSLHEVNTEVNRYISWPGQALAYKLGELKFKELRHRAEKKLKENFDVRAFHDLVLSKGALTLSILEKVVDEWIQSELAGNARVIKQ